MDGLALVLTVCAAVGGLLFLVRLVLQLLGGAGDVDHDLIGGNHDLSASDLSFKVLSFQAITAFLTMFGLAGRALLLDSRVGPGAAIAGATVAGALSVWIIGKLFSGARRLQSSGNLTLQDAVGASGQVYLNIPAGGSGQVEITYREHRKIHDARTENGDALATGTAITVSAVSGNTLLVRRA